MATIRGRRLFDARIGWRAALYFLNFGFARTMSFCGPILLSRILDHDLYGTIEYSLSVATFAAALLSAGIPGAYPQMTLLRRVTPMLDLLAASVVVPGIICMLCALAAFSYTGDTSTLTVVMFCIAQALAQGALSTYCRTKSMPNLSIWADSITILAMTSVAVVTFLIHSPSVNSIAIGSGAISGYFVLQALFTMYRTRQPDVRKRLLATLKFGVPVLLQSLTIIWCLVNGRIYAGTFLQPLDIAVYGFDFRIASALLLIHAVLATALSAKLYALRTKRYDQFAATYFAGLAALSLVLPFILLPLLTYTSSHEIASLDDTRRLLPVVTLQIFAWACVAFLEMRVSRARLAARSARLIAAMIVGFGLLTVGLGLKNVLDIRLIAWLASGQMVACALIQFFVLWKRGLTMPWALSSFLFGSGSIAIIAFVSSQYDYLPKY